MTKYISEKSFERQVLKFLKTTGCYQFKAIRSSRSGTPDRIICYKGMFIALELKKENGVISPLQKKHAAEILHSGGVHWFLKPSNFKEFQHWMLNCLSTNTLQS
jgi:hypothetical protein